MHYFAGEVEDVLYELDRAKSVDDLSPPVSKYCQCIKYNCGCCARFSVKEVKLINATGHFTDKSKSQFFALYMFLLSKYGIILMKWIDC